MKNVITITRNIMLCSYYNGYSIVLAPTRKPESCQTPTNTGAELCFIFCLHRFDYISLGQESVQYRYLGVKLLFKQTERQACCLRAFKLQYRMTPKRQENGKKRAHLLKVTS